MSAITHYVTAHLILRKGIEKSLRKLTKVEREIKRVKELVLREVINH